MTIAIYCEGETEKLILPRLLAHFQEKLRLHKSQARIQVNSFNGVGEYLRKIGPTVKNRIEIAQDRVVFGLIDYYGCGLQLVKPNMSQIDTIGRSIKYLRKQIIASVQQSHQSHFHQHFAVHEIEAWILADERPLRARLKDGSLGPWLTPEDENSDLPPAKKIKAWFLKNGGQAYQKTIDGAVLFNRVDPDAIYAKCPYFREFIDDLMQACDQEALSNQSKTRHNRTPK